MKIVFRDDITPLPCKLRDIITNSRRIYQQGDRAGFPSGLCKYTFGGSLYINSIDISYKHYFILTNDKGKTCLLNCVISNSLQLRTYDNKQLKLICFRVLDTGKNSIPIPESEICNMFSSISNDWVDWQT